MSLYPVKPAIVALGGDNNQALRLRCRRLLSSLPPPARSCWSSVEFRASGEYFLPACDALEIALPRASRAADTVAVLMPAGGPAASHIPAGCMRTAVAPPEMGNLPRRPLTRMDGRGPGRRTLPTRRLRNLLSDIQADCMVAQSPTRSRHGSVPPSKLFLAPHCMPLPSVLRPGRPV